MSYNCQHWECRWQNYCVKGRVGWGSVLFHTIMVFLTAGLWFIPLLVMFLVKRSRS